MIARERYLAKLEKALRRAPVVALLGPRQCGKTTLAKAVADRRGRVTYFDLQSVPDQRRLENPELMLGSLQGLAILDEIQERPDLFAALRVLSDRLRGKVTFLILGSASPSLIRGASESLAGRVEFVDLAGFDMEEVGINRWRALWVRGGFPPAFLAGSEKDSSAWREGFIRTFLQHDLPQFGIRVPAPAMRRFWTMLAHYHGQTWNGSELARSMGLSDKTVRSYLDLLTETYMVRQLQPWHENVGKRQVKSPKIYLRDTGLLHRLLSVDDAMTLAGHPRVGASWEGFALEQIVRLGGVGEPYCWATYGEAELDLLFFRGGKRYGVEFKHAEAPVITRSMHAATKTLKLNHLWVVCPGQQCYPVSDVMTVTGLGGITGGTLGEVLKES